MSYAWMTFLAMRPSAGTSIPSSRAQERMAAARVRSSCVRVPLAVSELELCVRRRPAVLHRVRDSTISAAFASVRSSSNQDPAEHHRPIGRLSREVVEQGVLHLADHVLLPLTEPPGRCGLVFSVPGAPHRCRHRPPVGRRSRSVVELSLPRGRWDRAAPAPGTPTPWSEFRRRRRVDRPPHPPTATPTDVTATPPTTGPAIHAMWRTPAKAFQSTAHPGCAGRPRQRPRAPAWWC